MKINKFIIMAIIGFCVVGLNQSNVHGQEEWNDEYSEVNGYKDDGDYLEQMGEEEQSPLLRGKLYSGYSRDGDFILSDGSSVYVANHVRGAYQGKTVNFYYVPSLGREIRDDNYDVYEISTYASLTMNLKRNCTVYTQPFIFAKFRTSKVAPAGTYRVKRRATYGMEIIMSDGTTGWVFPQYTDSNSFLATNYATFNEVKATLSVNTIGGIPIYQKMMPIREDKRTGMAQAPKYVTIHNTANTGNGANAASHANYQINGGNTWTSWHFTVDQASIYQSMPMNEIGWHAGDGGLTGNTSTVAIEICENADGNYSKSEYNAALLTAHILYENGLPSDAVKLHKDWSGKNCAHNILEGTKGTMGWSKFKQVVKEEYDKLASENEKVTWEKEYLDSRKLNYKSSCVSGFVYNEDVSKVVQDMQSYKAGTKVKILSSDGKEIKNGKIATGQKLSLTAKDGKNRVFNVVIKGDVNGDCDIKSNDFGYIRNYIMEDPNTTVKKSDLTAIQKQAADVNNDGKISSSDFGYIRNYIMKGTPIKQQ